MAAGAQKQGSNKGIRAARKLQRRIEAEARNAKTPVELTAAYRRRLFETDLETPIVF